MPLAEHDRKRLQSELKELHKECERIEMATHNRAVARQCLHSTIEFGKVTGSNAYNPAAEKYPWLPFQEQMAAYFDAPATRRPSIKTIAVARYHLKTEIGDHALARYALSKPKSHNIILSGTADLAIQNLAHITGMYKQDAIQFAFPKILLPAAERTAYTAKEIWFQTNLDGRFPNIAAFGLDSNMTGKHASAGGVLWLDDCVTKPNSETPEQRTKVWAAMSHAMSFVAVPGTMLWITYTRYGLDDAYSHLLSDDEGWKKFIEAGAISYGCFRINANGTLRALYPFIHCIAATETRTPVIFRGVTYHPERESIDEKKERLTKTEFNNQMLNNPQPDDEIIFRPEYFDSVLPVDGRNIAEWLAEPANIKQHILTKQFEELDRLPLTFAIAGDPSYGAKRNNDYQILGLVVQDAYGHWYVCEAYRKRLGTKGMEEYLSTVWKWLDDPAYNITLPLAIETHGAQKMIEPLDDALSRIAGRTPCRFAELKDNSNVTKYTRISSLEPYFRNGRVHWCANVEWFRRICKKNMTAYGSGEVHDDEADMLANLIQVFPSPGGAIKSKPIDLAPRYRRGRMMRIYR